MKDGRNRYTRKRKYIHKKKKNVKYTVNFKSRALCSVEPYNIAFSYQRRFLVGPL